jgi:hypothetical protein
MTLYITLAVIGTILLYVAYNLGRSSGIRELQKAIKDEIKKRL